MSPATLTKIDRQLWRLEKPLAEARENVRRLEEDERTLEWMYTIEKARLRKADDARVDQYFEMARTYHSWGWVRRALMRMIGVKRPDIRRDLVRDIDRIEKDPLADELRAVRKRLTAAHNKAHRLKEVNETLKSRKREAEHARWRSDDETIRHFEAPGRVRTALTRMVEEVFATIRRQEEAFVASDYEEVWRLWEVEKAQRVQLHGLWRIDPVRHGQGTWTAVTKEKRLPHGMGTDIPTMQAADATRQRLVQARVRGCPSEIQRLEDEERVLEKMFGEMGGCIYSERFYPAAGLLPSPGTAYPLPRMNGRHFRSQGETDRKTETAGATGGRSVTDGDLLPGFLAPRPAPRPWWRKLAGHP